MTTEAMRWTAALDEMDVPPTERERVQRVMQEHGIATSQALRAALDTCRGSEGLGRPYAFKGSDFGSDDRMRRAVKELLDIASTVETMDYSHSVEPYEHSGHVRPPVPVVVDNHAAPVAVEKEEPGDVDPGMIEAKKPDASAPVDLRRPTFV